MWIEVDGTIAKKIQFSSFLPDLVLILMIISKQINWKVITGGYQLTRFLGYKYHNVYVKALLRVLYVK